MRKLFTLAAAVLASISLFAAVETEVFDQTGAASNTDLVKTGATLTSAYVAGQGGAAIKDFTPENKGVKLRTQAKKVTISSTEYGYAILNVNSGYALKSVKIEGTSNGSNSIVLYGVYTDVNIEDVATALASATDLLTDDVTFPNKNTTYVSSPKLDIDAASNVLFLFAGSGDNQMRAIITVESERTATCTDPTIAWNVEPQGGQVGAADLTASVTVPAGQTIAWESSNEAVATVANGVIHYVSAGVTTIKASYTYVGDDFCNIEASISKSIVVPIVPEASAANDRSWYYSTAVPSENPDNGLNFGSTKTGNSLFGIKLNSDGYAWFAKPAVAGKLHLGAFVASGNAATYEVNVFACDSEGNKQGEALGSLATPHAGGVSEKLDIAADVAGIRLERKTSSEGVLYFIEFIANVPTAIDNAETAVKAQKRIVNGQFLIEKNGVLYNAQGAVIK